MKKFVTLAMVGFLTFGAQSELQAQVTPDVDFKGTIAIKTDPVLKPLPSIGGALDKFLVKTDPVLRVLDKFFVKTDPVLKPVEAFNHGLDMNMSSVMTLVSMLEKRGAQVQMQALETHGASVLHIIVDGMDVEPIVFEYRPVGSKN